MLALPGDTLPDKPLQGPWLGFLQGLFPCCTPKGIVYSILLMHAHSGPREHAFPPRASPRVQVALQLRTLAGAAVRGAARDRYRRAPLSLWRLLHPGRLFDLSFCTLAGSSVACTTLTIAWTV